MSISKQCDYFILVISKYKLFLLLFRMSVFQKSEASNQQHHLTTTLIIHKEVIVCQVEACLNIPQLSKFICACKSAPLTYAFFYCLYCTPVIILEPPSSLVSPRGTCFPSILLLRYGFVFCISPNPSALMFATSVHRHWYSLYSCMPQGPSLSKAGFLLIS